MILKKVDSDGEKYYVNAFTGKKHNIPYVKNNGKRESDKKLEAATMERVTLWRINQ